MTCLGVKGYTSKYMLSLSSHSLTPFHLEPFLLYLSAIEQLPCLPNKGDDTFHVDIMSSFCQAQPIVSSSWLRLAFFPAFPHPPDKQWHRPDKQWPPPTPPPTQESLA